VLVRLFAEQFHGLIDWFFVVSVLFPAFLHPDALARCTQEATDKEDNAFTTDSSHTPHLKAVDEENFPSNSVRNFEMRTRVASIAYDELVSPSTLTDLYQNPTLLQLVAAITGKENKLYLSDDPIGCCSINVFRPGDYHSFHFDESEFSTTLMLQEAEVPGTGLFQYTNQLRTFCETDLALEEVSSVIQTYMDPQETFAEMKVDSEPQLHTLQFEPGTLSVFSGSRSLHRVTTVEGTKSRLVAVLTFASQPGFRNSKEVQKLFWGRSSADD
jgi:hypothetical protein